MFCVRLSPDKRYDPPKAVVHPSTSHHVRNRSEHRSEWRCGFRTQEEAAAWARARGHYDVRYAKSRP